MTNLAPRRQNSETVRQRNSPMSQWSFAAIADHLEICYADVASLGCGLVANGSPSNSGTGAVPAFSLLSSLTAGSSPPARVGETLKPVALSLVLSPGDSEFLHARLQCRAFHAQFGGGAVGAGNYAA